MAAAANPSHLRKQTVAASVHPVKLIEIIPVDGHGCHLRHFHGRHLKHLHGSHLKYLYGRQLRHLQGSTVGCHY